MKESIMPASGSARRSPARRLLRSVLFVLPFLAVLAIAGCGQTTPLETFRELGAKVEVSRDQIVAVNFPPGTDDDDLAIFAEQPERFENLETVHLAGTDITDEGLAHLAGLNSLRMLYLAGTNIGDAAMEHVASLPNLQLLDIGDTAVSDEGLEHLTDVASLQQLILRGRPRPEEPAPRSWQDAVSLGIDLAGGTNLVYAVDREQAEKEITGEVMDQMVAAVSRRLNPSGTEEITVRKVGEDRIEVIIPEADPEVVQRKKDLMTRLGSLEFAMLANRRDHQEIIAEAQELPAGGDLRRERGDGTSYVHAGWRQVGVTKEGTPKDVGTTGDVESRPQTQEDGRRIPEFLVVFGQPEQRVTGKYLTRAFQTTDQKSFSPAVGFNFNTRGGHLFAQLTGNNRPMADGFHRRLSILLDGKVHSAPSINDVISTSGIITGDFSQEEIDELISVLNAGALTVPLQQKPISEQTISPLLGSDVQEKGKTAIIISLVAVFVVMLAYYLFPGFVADLCLLLNLVLIMGAMAFIDAAFTLPGLAGIVLTIGMAVDANVLIFERIREERARGSSTRMSIQNGFGKALSAIIDGNLTTLITAVVLYMIGTDQVRGFAVTLFIGIVVSLFTVLFFGRLMFDIWERKRWLKKISMNTLVPHTNINFLAKKWIAGAGSLALIVVGMGAVAVRGSDLLDIDFTGGTMVTFELTEPARTETVRDALRTSDVLGRDLTLEELTLAAEAQEGEGGRRFRVRTKEQNVEAVEDAVNVALTNADLELRRVVMEYDPEAIERIPEPGENEYVPPEAAAFLKGNQVPLTFKDLGTGGGVKLTTAQYYFFRQLDEIKVGNEPMYGKPEELVQFVGREQEKVATGAPDETVREAPKYTQILLKTKPELTEDHLRDALAGMQTYLRDNPVFPEVNKFDTAVAEGMQQSAILAILFSLVAIVAYIWFRFQRVTFGVAAVAALVHDVLIMLGVLALAGFVAGTPVGRALLIEDFKINLPMIAAFLTIVGYSLNDTIVIFDRIREIRGKNPALTDDMVNLSVNQTLARTLLTSLTTLIVVGILYGAGGEGLRGFTFSLLVGIVAGVYSTIFISNPVLLWLMNRPGAAPARSSAAARGTTKAARAGGRS